MRRRPTKRTGTASPSKSVRKYLEGHAEPEVELTARWADEYGNVLVVPVRSETVDLVERIRPALAGTTLPSLVILVVNARQDDEDAVLAEGRVLLDSPFLGAPTAASGRRALRLPKRSR